MSPDGTVTAEINDAREHSMSNPTVGTLRFSTGLELSRCNPAFIWSVDSRYVAVPQWVRRFGLFLRQRLLVIDAQTNTVFASRFTYWLIQPRQFDDRNLELVVSSSAGISRMRDTPVVIQIPDALDGFRRMPQS